MSVSRGRLTSSLNVRVAYPGSLGGGLPQAPLGYAFLVDDNGVFLTDDNGVFLMAEVS